MNIAPLTDILEAYFKQHHPWSIILGELIDNAFDANAKRVSIAFDGSMLDVDDDGDGFDKLEVFFQLGGRQHRRSTQLGRYGVGAKEAVLSAGKVVRITSVHRGVLRVMGCDWQRLLQSNQWDIEDPEVVLASGKPSGTRIRVEKLRSDRLKDPNALIQTLSRAYSPAIRQGRQIVLRTSAKAKPVTVPEYRLPTYPGGDSKSELLEFDGGRKAHVTLSLTPAGQTCQQTGLMIAYEYRVIVFNSRIGLGDEPTPGLFGWIELVGNWQLSKNKDRVLDLDDLGPAINTAFREIISRSISRASYAVFRNVARHLSTVLQSIAGNRTRDRKAVREQTRELTGAIEPTGKGGGHKRAVRSQDGTTFTERGGGARGVQIAFDRYGTDQEAYRVERGPGGTIIVYLNEDNEVLAADKGDERRMQYHAVYALAPYLALQHRDLFAETEDGRLDSRYLIARLTGKLLAGLDNPAGLKVAQ